MNNQLTKLHLKAKKEYAFWKGLFLGLLITGVPFLIFLLNAIMEKQ